MEGGSVRSTLKQVRQVLREVQPGELSPAMFKELQGIFAEGRDYERRLQRREKARARGPVFPTIAPSGRAFVDEEQEEDQHGPDA